jgi:hypothetical protein
VYKSKLISNNSCPVYYCHYILLFGCYILSTLALYTISRYYTEEKHCTQPMLSLCILLLSMAAQPNVFVPLLLMIHSGFMVWYDIYSILHQGYVHSCTRFVHSLYVAMYWIIWLSTKQVIRYMFGWHCIIVGMSEWMTANEQLIWILRIAPHDKMTLSN